MCVHVRTRALCVCVCVLVRVLVRVYSTQIACIIHVINLMYVGVFDSYASIKANFEVSYMHNVVCAYTYTSA